MIWQDMVFMLGQAAFAAALLPAIYGPMKPPRMTCGVTAVSLYAYVAAFFTLGLYSGAVTTLVCAVCWSILWVQKR